MQHAAKLHFTTSRPGLRPRRRMPAGRLLALLTMAFAATASSPGPARSYPQRPIRIVVPFPAGGPTDVAARPAAQSLSSGLGQNVIVENIAGAGGRIGAKVVAHASPDGYTLLQGGTNVNAIDATPHVNPGFDPLKSFAPVAGICVDSMVLVVSRQVSADTFEQFIRYAKDNPGKLTYGAPVGIYIHFASEFLKIKTGTDIRFVPYKGGAPAITDILGGHIDMLFNNKSTLLTYIGDGKLKPLAVTSDVRWPELPGTPTMREVGVAGFPKEVLFGLLAPAGTAPAIVEQINQALGKGLMSPEMRASLEKMGLEARIGTADDFAAALAEQAREWKTVVDATGIQLD